MSRDATLRLLALLGAAAASATRAERIAAVAASLQRSEFGARFAAEAPRRARATEAYARTLAGCGQLRGNVSLWVVYHATARLREGALGDPRATHAVGVRAAGPSVASPCDFDAGAFSELLAPDSFHQTLMSEHSALILLGLAAPALAGAGHRLGTCSWKAALKGRPPPCELLRGLAGAGPRTVTYWGPDAGPAGTGLSRHQAFVARKQPGGENLMGATIGNFFRDVFHATGDPAAWAPMDADGPALPWSNYFLAAPELWRDLAMFDALASAWLDGARPRTTASNASAAACPATYGDLHGQGVLAKVDVESNCRYCRAGYWTNWHRCRVGCHRCWSYVLEQLNVIFFRVLSDLRYVHDDARCGAPAALAPPRVAGRGDFDVAFLRDVYAAAFG